MKRNFFLVNYLTIDSISLFIYLNDTIILMSGAHRNERVNQNEILSYLDIQNCLTELFIESILVLYMLYSN